MLGGLVIIVAGSLFIYVIATWLDKRRADRCPKYRYEYRPYVRTFTEEQTTPASVFKMYQSMFWKQSPWYSTRANPQEYSRGYINPFVWGELPKTELGDVREDDQYLNTEFS